MCSSMRAKKTGAALKESRMLVVKKLGELVLSMLQTQARNSNNPLLKERTHLNFPLPKRGKEQQHFIGISGSYCFPPPPSKKLLWWRKKVCPDIPLQNSADFFFAPARSGQERVVKIAKQKFFFSGEIFLATLKWGPSVEAHFFCPSFFGASLWETGGKGSGKKSLIRVRDAYFFSTKTEAALLEIILLTSPSSPPPFFY